MELISWVLPECFGSCAVVQHAVGILCAWCLTLVGYLLELCVRNWAIVVFEGDVCRSLSVVLLHVVDECVSTLQVEPALEFATELKGTFAKDGLDVDRSLAVYALDRVVLAGDGACSTQGVDGCHSAAAVSLSAIMNSTAMMCTGITK